MAAVDETLSTKTVLAPTMQYICPQAVMAHRRDILSEMTGFHHMFQSTVEPEP